MNFLKIINVLSVFIILTQNSNGDTSICTQNSDSIKKSITKLENEFAKMIFESDQCLLEYRENLLIETNNLFNSFSIDASEFILFKETVKLIKDGDYDNAVIRFNGMVKKDEYFEKIIKIIIRVNSEFSQNFIIFLDNLDQKKYTLQAYESFLDLFNGKDSFELATIGYRINKLMALEIIKGNENTEEYKKIKNIYDNLPLGLKNFPIVIFKLKNKKFNDYLTLSEIQYDSERSKVFSTPNNIILRTQSFTLETINNGLSFRIKFEDKLLYAESDNFAYDEDRRRVFFSNSNNSLESCEWKFEYMQDGTFCIKNVYFDEYLYASINSYNYDEHNRRVFTWMRKGWDDNGFKWDFQLDVWTHIDILLKKKMTLSNSVI